MIDPKKELGGKTVLVTGGAGFIGSHLCDRLLSYGSKVICFDNLSTGSKKYVESHKDNPLFIFIFGDANVPSDIEKAFSNYDIDYVFHYAALVGVQRTIERPLLVFNDIEGMKNICDLSVKHGIKKIVYSSSSEIYGNQEKLPFNEDRSYHDTRNPYSLVKGINEKYLKHFCGTHGLPATSLRFFNVYGPRQESSRYGFVVGIFISQVLRDMPPTVFKDGSQTRDFTYIDDNLDVAIQVLFNEKTDGEILNIGTGVETSVLDLAKKIITISQKKLEPVFVPFNYPESERRVADISKMKKLTGHEPKVSLYDGLEKTYKWYENNYVK